MRKIIAVLVVLALAAAACSGANAATADVDTEATAIEVATQLDTHIEERTDELDEAAEDFGASADIMQELADEITVWAGAIGEADRGGLSEAQVDTLVDAALLYAEAYQVQADGLRANDLEAAVAGVEVYFDALNAWEEALSEFADGGVIAEAAVSTTTSTPPPASEVTATAEPSEPEVAVAPGQPWIEAMADDRYAEAVELSGGAAQRLGVYMRIGKTLQPDTWGSSVSGTDVTDGGVAWRFENGDQTTYDNVVVDQDGLVVEFDRNGASILDSVAPEAGPVATAHGVTAQVLSVFHREVDGIWHTTLAIEVDNHTGSEIYAWNTVLVGSDRRSADVDNSWSFGDWHADAISEEVLEFSGIADLTDGGELRIEVDYDKELVVEVPAVPNQG